MHRSTYWISLGVGCIANLLIFPAVAFAQADKVRDRAEIEAAIQKYGRASLIVRIADASGAALSPDRLTPADVDRRLGAMKAVLQRSLAYSEATGANRALNPSFLPRAGLVVMSATAGELARLSRDPQVGEIDYNASFRLDVPRPSTSPQ